MSIKEDFREFVLNLKDEAKRRCGDNAGDNGARALWRCHLLHTTLSRRRCTLPRT